MRKVLPWRIALLTLARGTGDFRGTLYIQTQSNATDFYSKQGREINNLRIVILACTYQQTQFKINKLIHIYVWVWAHVYTLLMFSALPSAISINYRSRKTKKNKNTPTG